MGRSRQPALEPKTFSTQAGCRTPEVPILPQDASHLLFIGECFTQPARQANKAKSRSWIACFGSLLADVEHACATTCSRVLWFGSLLWGVDG